MIAKEAKEIIRAGFAWANWTDEQKEAFKLAYEAIEKAEQVEKILCCGDFDSQAKLDNINVLFFDE